MEAELALGRHARLIADLQGFVRDHPLRERLWAQLMLALYRDGRQAEALAVYHDACRSLLDEVGLAPGPELRELERRILAQDERLQLDGLEAGLRRAVLVAPSRDVALEPLAALAEPLATMAKHELIVAALADGPRGLVDATGRLRALHAHAVARGACARVAAFTSDDRGLDVVRLAAEYDVSLVLLDAPDALLANGVAGGELATVLARAVCDVAVVVAGDWSAVAARRNRAVVVPFAGHEHDWAAAELGAWLSLAEGRSLRLLGTRADPAGGRRDASRLLGHASLALQRSLGIAAEPVLVAGGPDGIVDAAGDAALVVVGLSDRWTREGLGAARVSIARRIPRPVVFVRRGVRPGGLAPRAAVTRFTWSRVAP